MDECIRPSHVTACCSSRQRATLCLPCHAHAAAAHAWADAARDELESPDRPVAARAGRRQRRHRRRCGLWRRHHLGGPRERWAGGRQRHVGGCGDRCGGALLYRGRARWSRGDGSRRRGRRDRHPSPPSAGGSGGGSLRRGEGDHDREAAEGHAGDVRLQRQPRDAEAAAEGGRRQGLPLRHGARGQPWAAARGVWRKNGGGARAGGVADPLGAGCAQVEQMEASIAEGKFLEYAQVHGRYYGTSKQSVADVCDAGKVCPHALPPFLSPVTIAPCRRHPPPRLPRERARVCVAGVHPRH